MARPERHDADYFPFYVKDGKTLFVLQHKYGLEGIGFFTNLMRLLTATTDHHICVADPGDSLYVFSRIGVDEERGLQMIEDMVKTGKLHRELWEDERIIVSPDLLNSLGPLYSKRNNEIITPGKISNRGGNTGSEEDIPQVPMYPEEETPQAPSKTGKPVSETHKGSKGSKGSKVKGEVSSSPLHTRYETSREYWNALGLPEYPYISVNCPPADMHDITPTFDAHPNETIFQAIDNYWKIRGDPGYKLDPEYQSFIGFMKPGKGVDKYQNSVKPLERCRVDGKSRGSPDMAAAKRVYDIAKGVKL